MGLAYVSAGEAGVSHAALGARPRKAPRACEDPRIGALLDHVRSYYQALNTGDPDRVAEHFTADATHYYTRLGPHEGAQAIAQNTKLAVEQIDGQWHFENGIDDGEQAVIEWSMTWRDPQSGERRLDRGTEWFRFEDGKIAEVRAYHHSGPKNRSGNLLGFDHSGRGHTTL
ncbi:MAG: nuclear transport factor 2 family protein [Thermoleophilaceae bacterium]|nr:nuclear transport factor 2 family protein [Thermoleophilaceae bacterium]